MSDERHGEPGRDRVDFGAPRSGSALGGLQWRQLGLLVAAGLWALAWTRSGTGAGGVVVGTLGAAGLTAAALVRAGGRLPAEWAVVGATFALRHARGTARYRHQLGRTAARLPAHMSGIRILEIATDRGTVGLVRDGTRLVAILEVTAEPIMLAGSAELAGRRAAWGGVLAGLARPGSPVVRVQWVARTQAIGGPARGAYLDAGLVPRRAEHAVASYLEVVDRIGDAAQDYVLTIALGIDAGRRPGTAAAQYALDAAAELDAQLRSAGLGRARLVGAGEVQTILRAAGDPADDDAGRRPAEDGVAPPADAEDPGPMASQEDWGTLRTDATWHASFWISQWPRGEIDADALAPLVLAGRPGRTVSVVMEPRDPVRAVREAEHSRVRHRADDELRQRAGFVGSVRRRRQQAAISAQERELADGHAAYRFAGYLTVSAATPQALEDACRELAAAAPLAHCEVRRLWGEQAAGRAATLPLCRGL